MILSAPLTLPNVSPAFKPGSKADSDMAQALMEREGTPEAIKFFAEHHKALTSYSYWFLLSTLWVSHTGNSDMAMWRELLGSPRKFRAESIMKPDELRAFKDLPGVVTVYRAHRRGEKDWISYTLSKSTAARFAQERGVRSFNSYNVDKEDILALFTRRGEDEVLILDRAAPVKTSTVPVFFVGAPQLPKEYPDEATAAAARDHSRITPHGKALGEQTVRLLQPALDALDVLGVSDDRCQSCAFRAGTVPNGCAQTQMDALKCVMEGVPFKCHASVKDENGECIDLCHGWIASRFALSGETTTMPWDFSKEDESE